jgi:hypothetical protein
MSLSPGLPFQRGTTLYSGDADLISAVVESNYLGKTFTLLDTVHSSTALAMGNGMNLEVKVVPVKNTSGAAITGIGVAGVTAANSGNLLLWDDTTAGNFLKCVDAKADGDADADGPLAGFFDDQHTATVADDDVFYIVTAGPVHVMQGSEGGVAPAIGNYAEPSTDNDTGKVEATVTAAGWSSEMVGRFERVATSATDAIHRLIANLSHLMGA